MNRSLHPIVWGLVSLFFFAWAGLGVYTGHVSVGKFNPRIVDESTDPHAFWNVVMIRLIAGVFCLCFAVYQFLRNRGS